MADHRLGEPRHPDPIPTVAPLTIPARPRRRVTRLGLVMALVWILLAAGIAVGFMAGSNECLLLNNGYGGGTTCD